MTRAGLMPAYLVLSLANFNAFLEETASQAERSEILATGKYSTMLIVVVNGSDIVETAPSVADVAEMMDLAVVEEPQQEDIMPWPPRWN
jgi:hypothetical protein